MFGIRAGDVAHQSRCAGNCHGRQRHSRNGQCLPYFPQSCIAAVRISMGAGFVRLFALCGQRVRQISADGCRRLCPTARATCPRTRRQACSRPVQRGCCATSSRYQVVRPRIRLQNRRPCRFGRNGTLHAPQQRRRTQFECHRLRCRSDVADSRQYLRRLGGRYRCNACKCGFLVGRRVQRTAAIVIGRSVVAAAAARFAFVGVRLRCCLLLFARATAPIQYRYRRGVFADADVAVSCGR